jgi:hypothetical protein
MAAAVTPATRIRASSDCSSTASGVVCPAAVPSSPIRYWIVPMRPVLWPAARSMDSTRKDVVVLPLVPVMPTRVRAREGWPKNAAASRPSASRADGTRTRGASPPGSGSAPSATTATAPRASASPMYRRPSCLRPGTATKRPPGLTLRES